MTDSISPSQLKAFVERLDRLEDDKDGINGDIAEVYAEVKSSGFDKGVVRKIVRMRRQSAAKREEEAAIMDLYLSALGMEG